MLIVAVLPDRPWEGCLNGTGGRTQAKGKKERGRGAWDRRAGRVMPDRSILAAMAIAAQDAHVPSYRARRFVMALLR